MKKKFLFAIFFLVSVQYANSQSNLLFPTTNGSLYEFQLFNKGGKPQGKTELRILSTLKASDTLKVLSELTSVDEKGGRHTRQLAPMKSYGKSLSIDPLYMFNLFPQVFFSHPKESFTGNGYLEYPTSLEVSKKLQDTVINMQSVSKRGAVQKSKLFVTDRRVVTKEKVMVAAGEFEAFVVESNVGIFYVDDKGKAKVAAFNGSVREWMTAANGIVKRAIFNGKYLMFYEELVAVKQP